MRKKECQWVVTAAMAIDLDNGTTIILIINEVLWLGNSQYTSLLNLNQVRYAGHQADDIPLYLSQGSSIHGIKTKDEVHIFTCQLQERWKSASTLSSPWTNRGILLHYRCGLGGE